MSIESIKAEREWLQAVSKYDACISQATNAINGVKVAIEEMKANANYATSSTDAEKAKVDAEYATACSFLNGSLIP
jgi:phage shock protein A